MPRKIPETESLEEAYLAMRVVGPKGYPESNSLDNYVEITGGKQE